MRFQLTLQSYLVTVFPRKSKKSAYSIIIIKCTAVQGLDTAVAYNMYNLIF